MTETRLRPGMLPAGLPEQERLPPEAHLPVSAAAEPDAVPTEFVRRAKRRTERRRTARRIFGSLLGTFVVGLAVLGIESFLADLFARNEMLGTLFALLIAGIVAAGAYLVWSEVRAIRRLRDAEAVRAEARRLAERNGYGHALPFTMHARELLPDDPVIQRQLKQFDNDDAKDAYSDRQVLELFARDVLHPIDQRAYAIVGRAARDAAIGVSASPFPSLDVVISVWRSTRMIREIAELYGFRPTAASTWALVRNIFKTAALSSAIDLIGDAWLQHLGGRLASLVSSKLAEGVVVGVRVARLGLLTMESCRPLPFSEIDEPGLNRLRKNLFKGLEQ